MIGDRYLEPHPMDTDQPRRGLSIGGLLQGLLGGLPAEGSAA